MKNQIDEMMKQVEINLGKKSASGDARAIVGMLGIVAHLLGEIGEKQETMAADIAQLAKQFDSATWSGHAMAVLPK